MNQRVLPGFRTSLGFTITYLTILVVIPLAACVITTLSLSWESFWQIVLSKRAIAAYCLTFRVAVISAIISVGIGFLLAWVLVRYSFPAKRFFDSIIDLPFALPTAVAGLVYTHLYYRHGWFGRPLHALGIDVVYTEIGIILVLIFIGFPFVVRTIQPVLESLDSDMEEAASSLGSSRWQTFARVILPSLYPAMITGFVLAFARALGEYGAIIFIAGNRPFHTEIATVLIVSRLESYHYAEATAIGMVVLFVTSILLLLINRLKRWIEE